MDKNKNESIVLLWPFIIFFTYENSKKKKIIIIKNCKSKQNKLILPLTRTVFWGIECSRLFWNLNTFLVLNINIFFITVFVETGATQNNHSHDISLNGFGVSDLVESYTPFIFGALSDLRISLRSLSRFKIFSEFSCCIRCIHWYRKLFM